MAAIADTIGSFIHDVQLDRAAFPMRQVSPCDKLEPNELNMRLESVFIGKRVTAGATADKAITIDKKAELVFLSATDADPFRRGHGKN